MKSLIMIKINQIDVDLLNHVEQNDSLALMNGLQGSVLFYLNLFKAFGDSVYLDKANRVINKIFFILQQGNYKLTHSYCDGLTGLGYFLHYMQQQQLINGEADEFLQGVDQYVTSQGRCLVDQSADLDFLHGGVGMGLYLLDRQKEGYCQGELANRVLKKLIYLIDQSIKRSSILIDFYGKPEYAATTKTVFNLGMAHGASAYLVFLIRYTQIHPDNQVLKSIRALVDCLLVYYRPMPENAAGSSYFPSIVHSDKPVNYDVPLGWCYGDLSIAIGLWQAGLALEDQSITATAERIALGTTNRKTLDEAGINDATLCHGTACVAAAYRLWYAYTGRLAFRDAYNHWIQLTLEQGSAPDGIGGYVKFMGYKDGLPVSEPQIGMLYGGSGIGLVLTDYLAGEKINWEQFFLLN